MTSRLNDMAGSSAGELLLCMMNITGKLGGGGNPLFPLHALLFRTVVVVVKISRNTVPPLLDAYCCSFCKDPCVAIF